LPVSPLCGREPLPPAVVDRTEGLLDPCGVQCVDQRASADCGDLLGGEGVEDGGEDLRSKPAKAADVDQSPEQACHVELPELGRQPMLQPVVDWCSARRHLGFGVTELNVADPMPRE